MNLVLHDAMSTVSSSRLLLYENVTCDATKLLQLFYTFEYVELLWIEDCLKEIAYLLELQ